ncbi:MAG TPA: hypothetical protein VNY05_20640 [Candidatus Acidoferrales bacterium]|jgi:hypothetical protein|nr:hypothetical protein [Candidatus Acidoferrales bacterium]
MKGTLLATLAVATLGLGPLARPAFAYPTMIRLGYVNCAACHIAPQGGGLLNSYGRGIDEAQSLRAGEYKPSENRIANALNWGGRITQDIRVVAQETLNTSTGAPILGVFRSRLMYRNNTDLGKGFRVSAVVVGEHTAALRPSLAYDPPVKQTDIYVTTALISYRPTKTLEFSAGRDQLPTGLNLTDLGMYIKARDQYGYYDAPTQVKMSKWGDHYTISPYVFGPGGNEHSGFHESGAGMLAEVDILPGNHRTVVGVNGLHGMSTKLDRTVIGPYARLGFGRWGIFAEHDFTDRTLKLTATPVAFRQEASYALAFFAIREWLVPSLGVERLIVHKPYKETQVAPRFELAARLSSNFTLGLTTRLQQNVLNGKIAPSAQLTLAMKTVN